MINCNYCNKEFSTIGGCKHHEYYCDKNPNRHVVEKINYVCPFCNKNLFMPFANFERHKKFCKDNPNKQIYKGHKLSDSEKKNLSDIMKEKHKLGTAFTWSKLRGKCKPSYPEQWLMKVIENENLNNNYIHEYPFYTFSLDFAWVNEKKVIEMDGRFHKISEYQQNCDLRKDKLLKDNGWKELRIDWEYCSNNTKEIIEQIKNFLNE